MITTHKSFARTVSPSAAVPVLVAGVCRRRMLVVDATTGTEHSTRCPRRWRSALRSLLLREIAGIGWLQAGGSLLHPNEAEYLLEGRPIVPTEDFADAAAQMAEDAVHLGVGDPLGDDAHCLAANARDFSKSVRPPLTVHGVRARRACRATAANPGRSGESPERPRADTGMAQWVPRE